jgi:hypothetical protein
MKLLLTTAFAIEHAIEPPQLLAVRRFATTPDTLTAQAWPRRLQHRGFCSCFVLEVRLLSADAR